MKLLAEGFVSCRLSLGRNQKAMSKLKKEGKAFITRVLFMFVWNLKLQQHQCKAFITCVGLKVYGNLKVVGFAAM